jgi:chaperonin GroES
MATQLAPLHDRIVVRRITEEEKTASGLYIPDTAKDKPQQGVVLATGEGRYEAGHLIPIGVHVGDQVLFGKYAGTEIKVDNETLLILREEEILTRVIEVEPVTPKLFEGIKNDSATTEEARPFRGPVTIPKEPLVVA